MLLACEKLRKQRNSKNRSQTHCRKLGLKQDKGETAMERKNGYKIPESFDYESLKTLTENDLLRNGCEPEKIEFLFAMGSEPNVIKEKDG
ncbi:MAG: hypothetical protein ACSW8C_05360 [bacterium]